MVIRGSNGVAPGRLERVPAELEMAALDDLGPLCRKAITDGPIPMLAYSIVRQIIEYNDQVEEENEEREAKGLPLRPYLDLHEPKLDRRLAEGVLQNSFALILNDRTEDDARMGLKPLRPKLSARTARERRKTEGRRFRGW